MTDAESKAAMECATACARALFAIEGRVPDQLRQAINEKRMRILAATVRNARELADLTGRSLVEVLEERRQGWQEIEAAVKKYLGIKLEPFNPPPLTEDAARRQRN